MKLIVLSLLLGGIASAIECYDTPVTVLYPGSKTCPQS